jgi:Flp pilus assembly pilin Flp
MISRFWREDVGQDVAEYAMMLIIILLLGGVTVKLIGSNIRHIFNRTELGEAPHYRSNDQAVIVQHCEDAVRDQIDGNLRAEFPTPSPEVRVRRIDNNDFSMESFVETRSAEGSVTRMDYSCSARCTQADGCTAIAQLRR